MPSLVERLKQNRGIEMTPELMRVLMARIRELPDQEKRELEAEFSEYERALAKERRQRNFLEYVRHVWPAFINGRHFQIMANAFERIADGSLKRLAIHMPPRHGKSEQTSWLFPSWYIGKFPDRKIIQCGHTAELSVGFGSKVRNTVNSPEFKATFPGVFLSADTKAKGRWRTNRGGEYHALGVGGAVAGKGADLLIIDDPHSEQDAVAAISNPQVYDSVYEWFKSGPVQRLQPSGAICLVLTRWGKRDLAGRIQDAAARMDLPDQWEVIEFPAILPSGSALWPEYWPIDKLLQKKAEINDVHLWNAQYQQNPTSEEGAIIKREWWRTWPDKTNPPRCEFVIQSWDTAYTEKTRNDFCACTTWGVFKPDLDYLRQHGVEMPPLLPDARHIIVLDSFQERMEFPDLKVRAKQEYQRMKPDCLLVEGKAAGMPLIQELLAMGIPASRYDPNRKEGDKFVRLNSVAELFKSGMVWAPDMGWARELRDSLAEFPNGEHDDLVDSASQALLRFRQGGLVALATDETAKKRDPRRVREYY